MRFPAPLLLAAALWLAPFGAARAHAAVGTEVADVELPSASGAPERLLRPGMKATLVLFVRTGQERSAEALKAMAKCERLLAAKPVRFVAVASGETSPAAAAALVAAAGARMPVLLDRGEQLYDRLDVRNHPVAFVLNARNAVASFEQYRQIGYCEVVLAQLRFLLGELDEASLARALDPPRSSMPGEDPRDIANRDVKLGRLLLERGQHAKAIRSATRAIERAPSAAAFALLGDVYAAQGDCRRATGQYQQARKLDPAEPRAAAGLQACAGR